MKDESSVLSVFALQASADSVQLFGEVPNPDKFKKKGLVVLKLQEQQLAAGNVL